MSFVHLHTHSHYSLLDGLAKIDDLVSEAKKMGMPALAITDHGNLYGAIEFYKAAKKAGVKLFYDPSIIIWHKNAQSTGGSGSKLQQKYQRINRLRFGLKYAPIKTKLHLIKNYFQDFIHPQGAGH